MKFCDFVILLAVCFLMIKEGHSKGLKDCFIMSDNDDRSARKRTTSCDIPEDVRGSWRAPDFKTGKGTLELSIDIGPMSATMHQKLGEHQTEIKFDCTSGSDDGYFLTKSKVPETYKSLYKQMRALYKIEAFTCLKFDRTDSFLTIYMYSFKENPSSENPEKVCSGMDKKDRLNAIGFSPTDQFTDPQKHAH